MNKTLGNTLRLGAAATLALGLGAAALWAGLYDVGADAPHSRPVYAVLDYARERSIAVRAGELQVPALDDPERIRQGAGNYEAMCAGCHLAPGRDPTELARGLYPAPPDLSRHEVDPAQAFWTVKHGIKASGMPAWGASMDDAHLWNLVAFLRRMPRMDAAEYRDWVERSDGHSHGGGETAGVGAAAADDGHAHAEPAHPRHADSKPTGSKPTDSEPTDSKQAGSPGHADHAHPETSPARAATTAPARDAAAAQRAHRPSPAEAGAGSEHRHGHGEHAHPAQAAPDRTGPADEPGVAAPTAPAPAAVEHEAHPHRH